MTLSDIIELYLKEEYTFYKYRDKDGKDIQTHFVFETHADYLGKYLDFYKSLPDLTEVIVYATDGIFKITNRGFEFFIRHNHQEVFQDKLGNTRGVSFEVSKQVRDNLLKRINDVLQARTFDDLIAVVSQCKVRGFGELSIYDTAMRIAAHMNIHPDKVYLHAGASKGMEILEEKGYVQVGISQRKVVDMVQMPSSMQKLGAAETEHCLCSMKERMLDLQQNPNPRST